MEQITTPSAGYSPGEESALHPVSASLDRREGPERIHLVQYDKSLPVAAVTFTLGGRPYRIPQGAAVNLRLEKPDKKYVYDPALGLSEDRLTAYFAVTAQMTAAAGTARAVLEIVWNGGVVGTAPLLLEIDRNPIPEEAVESREEWHTVQETAAQVLAAAEAAGRSREAAALSEEQAKLSAQAAAGSEENAAESAKSAALNAAEAALSSLSAQTSAEASAQSAGEALTQRNLAQSYAIGNTGSREGENTDNAAYYYEQAKRVAQGIQGALQPHGSLKFQELAAAEKESGWMYNLTDAFVTDSTFVEGEGHPYPAGTNVYYTAEGLWDCLPGVMVTSVRGEKEPVGRQGDVVLTPENLGLGEEYLLTPETAGRIVSAFGGSAENPNQAFAQIAAALPVSMGSFTPYFLDRSDKSPLEYTAGSSVGQYLKIGRLVLFRITISRVSGLSSSSSQLAGVGPLPFPAASGGGYFPLTIANFYDVFSDVPDGNPILAAVSSGNDVISLWKDRGGNNAQFSQERGNGTLSLGGVYWTN